MKKPTKKPKSKSEERRLKVQLAEPRVGLKVQYEGFEGTISRLNADGSFSVKTAAGFIHQARLAPQGEWSAAN